MKLTPAQSHFVLNALMAKKKIRALVVVQALRNREQEIRSLRERLAALELLSAAYALDPAFGEAEIVKLGAGARPAFPDNRPRIITAKGYIYVNGLYRHGFLLAPALAELVANYVATGETHPEVFLADLAQR